MNRSDVTAMYATELFIKQIGSMVAFNRRGVVVSEKDILALAAK